MSLLLSIRILVLTSLLISTARILVEAFTHEEKEAFLQWQTEFNVTYDDDSSRQEAFSNFCSNRLKVNEHNQEYYKCNVSWALGMWRKSDLNESSINLELNGLQLSQLGIMGRAIYISGVEIKSPNTTYLNYAEKGYCTPVQDQGRCGSCWAFAAVATIESMIFKQTGLLRKYSEQQLVDCSRPYGNLGCTAGVVGFAYKYVKDFGIANAIDYPYRGIDTKRCSFNAKTMNTVKVSGYTWIAVKDENFLRDILWSIGPLAVGVDASHFTFQNYKAGIYNDTRCTTNLNHAMTLVGFGSDPKWGEYWILKNSYGYSWGENGYMRISKGYNRCGIRYYVVFPNP